MKGVVKGTFDVVWRMAFDSTYSTNFEADWSVTEEYNGDQEKIFTSKWADAKKEVAPKCGKGYFEWKMGTITVKHDFSNLTFYVLGGNNNWFGGWKIDYVKLIPK